MAARDEALSREEDDADAAAESEAEEMRGRGNATGDGAGEAAGEDREADAVVEEAPEDDEDDGEKERRDKRDAEGDEKGEHVEKDDEDEMRDAGEKMLLRDKCDKPGEMSDFSGSGLAGAPAVDKVRQERSIKPDARAAATRTDEEFESVRETTAEEEKADESPITVSVDDKKEMEADDVAISMLVGEEEDCMLEVKPTARMQGFFTTLQHCSKRTVLREKAEKLLKMLKLKLGEHEESRLGLIEDAFSVIVC